MTVIETNMWDGNDLIHEWYSVKEALESGRFDYLIENGDYKEKQLTSCKSVEELVKLAGYPFSVWKELTLEEWNNRLQNENK
jgi:hypothetical protein